ncbi:MAG: hypothetical protein AAF629_19490, partial [Chloroflexota bacterium]
EPRVLITTYYGGIYLSDDMGDTWIAKNHGIRRMRVRDVKFSPNYTADKRMFSITSHSFYHSDDDGDHWKIQKLGKLLGTRSSFWEKTKSWLMGETITFPWYLVASPNISDDDTLYLTTARNGLYRSQDGGKHWIPIWNALGERIMALALSPNFAEDKTLYALLRASGIYKSNDGGQSWAALSVPDSTTSILESHSDQLYLSLAIAANYQAQETIFVGTTQGLFQSIDQGKTWRQLSEPLFETSAIANVIALSPNYEHDKTLIVHFKGKGMYRSVDGGETFSSIALNLFEQNHAPDFITFSPNFSEDGFIMAGGEELYRSTDGGDHWEILHSRPIRYEDDLPAIQFLGSWQLYIDDTYSGTSVTYSQEAEDQATLSFVGQNIRLLGTKGPSQGIANVYIDDVLKQTIDLYQTQKETNTVLYEAGHLSSQSHTITVEVAGDKNTNSAGYYVEIDGFEITP